MKAFNDLCKTFLTESGLLQRKEVIGHGTNFLRLSIPSNDLEARIQTEFRYRDRMPEEIMEAAMNEKEEIIAKHNEECLKILQVTEGLLLAEFSECQEEITNMLNRYRQGHNKNET